MKPVAREAYRLAQDLYRTSGLDSEYVHRALTGPSVDFLSRTGKGFRGSLVQSSWRIAGGAPTSIIPERLAVVLELLHAGSLVIDDIQDDSSQRRGAPCLHRGWGMPLALNTGNWMYFAAFELLDELELPDATQLALHRELRKATIRCHGGQGLDLSVSISDMPPEEIPALVRATTDLKTSSLLGVGARMSAIAAGADSSAQNALGAFGSALGCALQMLDDLGGVASNRRRPKGLEDLRHGRPTWVWAWAQTYASPEQLSGLLDRCREVQNGADATELIRLLRSIVSEPGRFEAAAQLRVAFKHLSSHFPQSAELDNLIAEIQRLEKSYD
jgi:geranylgeranyl pyrophosphate synthase